MDDETIAGFRDSVRTDRIALLDEFTKITVPTLVIHGDADAIVAFEVSGKRSAEMIAGATLVLIEGGPHGVDTPTVRHRADRVSRRLSATKR